MVRSAVGAVNGTKVWSSWAILLYLKPKGFSNLGQCFMLAFPICAGDQCLSKICITNLELF